MSVISVPQPAFFSAVALVVVGITSALFYRIFYSLFLHPLAKFPGPWYAASFSLPLAFINWKRIEPEWLGGLVKRYGSKFTLPFSHYLHINLILDKRTPQFEFRPTYSYSRSLRH
jgi:hypothetical protein